MCSWTSVVPHAGTWIEITVTKAWGIETYVVPHAGTWIEIAWPAESVISFSVVPHAGTWIEIFTITTSFVDKESFPTWKLKKHRTDIRFVLYFFYKE